MLLQDYSQQPRHAHPNCPLPEEWAKKNVYIYTAKYYSNIKMNEIQSSVTDDTYGCSSHCVRKIQQAARDKYCSLLVCGN